MQTTVNVLTALIAALHVYILVLEMCLWDKPKGLRAFGMTPEFAASTKVLAANQAVSYTHLDVYKRQVFTLSFTLTCISDSARQCTINVHNILTAARCGCAVAGPAGGWCARG